MSVLTSTLPSTLNLSTPGLFSSRTAFQRPKLNSNLKNSLQANVKLTIKYPEDDQSKRLHSQIQTLQGKEDLEPYFCEPIKKVKSVSNKLDTINLLETNKIQTQQKPYKLTKEMVFETPLKANKSQLNNFFDNDKEEGSDLSFISPCSSINELEVIDEEVIEVTREQSHKTATTGETEVKTSSFVAEPLVVMNGFTNQINYLAVDGYTIPNIVYPVAASYNPYSNLNQLMTFNNSFNGISNLNQLLQPNLNNFYQVQPIVNYPSINMSDFLQNQNKFVLEENGTTNHMNAHFDNLRAKIIDLEADGYDSDSYATRSTGVDMNQEGIERSQKSLSPPYVPTEEINVEDNISNIALVQAKKKNKMNKKPKNKVQREAGDIDRIKSKKGRALNLDIDINPKHLKVERRLNKLQLLRYQQEAPEAEFEEYMRKCTDKLTVSRDSSLFNDNDSQSTASNDDKAIMAEPKPVSYEDTLAIIPALTLESSRRRANLVTVWTLGDMNADDVNIYMQKLSETVEFLVTDQEKALKILKTFGMNIETTLEAVRGDKAAYSELLRMKVKRLRRY